MSTAQGIIARAISISNTIEDLLQQKDPLPVIPEHEKTEAKFRHREPCPIITCFQLPPPLQALRREMHRLNEEGLKATRKSGSKCKKAQKFFETEEMIRRVFLKKLDEEISQRLPIKQKLEGKNYAVVIGSNWKVLFIEEEI